VPFEYVEDLAAVAAERPTALAIGNFDGVHQGHRKLLTAMIAAAHAEGLRPAVLTFFPHPRRVILGETGRFYLARLPERVALLRELGIELVIALPFTEAVRTTRAATFVRNLTATLSLRQLWGGNFSLGYNREGDVDFLRAAGQELGFAVHLLDAKVTWRDALVSSSRVRRGLAAGDMEDVTGCLTRPYLVSGTVQLGARRGRTIGFPTANISAWEEQVLPAHGVYATHVHLDGALYPAATNVGVRPTVNGDREVTIEAHLLDFEGDLYGKTVGIAFQAFIRPEMKFPGLDALREQIGRDVAHIRRLLLAQEP